MKKFRVVIMLFIYSESFGLIQSANKPTHDDCLSTAGKILSADQRLHGTGQILVSQDWFLTLEGKRFQKLKSFSDFHNRIPWLVSGGRRERPTNLSNSTIKPYLPVSKFTSSKFAHIQQLESTSIAWKSNLIYLRFKYGRTHFAGKSGFTSIRKLVQTDLHLIMFNYLNISSFLQFKNVFAYRHTIWVGLGCGYHCSSTYDTVLFNQNQDNSTELQIIHHGPITSNHLCIYSSVRDVDILKNAHACRNRTLHVKQFIKSLLKLYNPSHSKSELEIYNKTILFQETDPSPHKTNRSIWYRETFSNKGYLYSALVFITKKSAENATNVWGPFSLVSWIGILTAYTVTAIVFGVIKIVTMNNLDNSWYDCLINHIFSFVNEERVIRQKKEILPTIARDQSNKVNRNGTNFYNVGSVESQKISVKSSFLPSSKYQRDNYFSQSQFTIIIHRNQNGRGKMSKAILYGTIRVVSFILLAVYEGKLYNTITFPKSKLVASFDELISGEKYSVKFSNGVANHENISDKIPTDISSFRGVPQTSENKSNRAAEGVTILDCVNWVESDPDTNHACVGYEFELRNLHKAQKSDKILVKSKRKLLRFGSGGSVRLSRRRGFTMFPGGFQISKWVLESGILQLWSIVENAFMESLFNPNWSDPFKVFTIRDYLGLFVVYAMLLILASIMFLLEHSITHCKHIVKNKSLIKTYKRMYRHLKLCKVKQILACRCWKRKMLVNVRSKKYFRSLGYINNTVTVSPLND